MTTQSPARLAALPPLHSAALLLPSMAIDEYEALRDSIREHGQLEPCVMLGDELLDGRHRYRVCLELGIRPKTRPYTGECGSPITFVLAQNVHRRHLDAGQRAALGAEVLPLYEAEAAERQRQAGIARSQQAQRDHAGRMTSQLAEIVPQAGTVAPPASTPTRPREPEAAAQAAKAVGTNRKYVEAAAELKDQAPDLFEAVKQGEQTVPAARRELTQRQAQQDEAQLQVLVSQDAAVVRQRLRRSYFTAIHTLVRDLLPLRPEAVAETFTDADWRESSADAARLTAWFSALAAAKPVGLRVVGGDDD